MQDAVSVTLLTGFLGAGKTTLLNYFLAHHGDASVAILENEFGAVNIDGALLAAGENVNIVELSNGCVCCSVRGEFSAALHALLDQRAWGDMHFDRLIVETTGLADPAPVLQTFLSMSACVKRCGWMPSLRWWIVTIFSGNWMSTPLQRRKLALPIAYC
ncbi:GTP-binding protein [Apirhabdus apintestini]|nr:GTP-binding protein [Enterobacteriaceae bacterium CA-0114]